MTSKLIWNADEVARAVHGKTSNDQRWQANNISIDSRSIQRGDLFIALKGPAHDGHKFVTAALEAGAAAAIVSQMPEDASEDLPLVSVKDTFVALEELGRAGRQRSQAKIIGVTGSVGKTSTKEMLRLMLGAMGETYANEGSFNNHWGVPLSLARLPTSAQYGVFELGMNHPGELALLSGQVQPHVALITNVEAVHLEFFPSLDAIADAKSEIFLGVGVDGAAVLNRDNKQFARLEKAARDRGIKNILSFGFDTKSDAKLIECRPTPSGSAITAEILGVKIQYHLNVPGEHLALNSLGALLAAVAAGGNASMCAAALGEFKLPKGRGVAQTIQLAEGAIELIDESYNASPVAVRASIQVLARMQPKAEGRRILVLGDMRELGDSSPALHAALAQDIVDAKIDRVYCCGEMMSHLYEALPPTFRGFHANDSATLAPRVASDLNAGDIVTVKGSKTMLMPLVIDAINNLSENHDSDNIAAKKKKIITACIAALFFISMTAPACGEEYDLTSRDWSTTSSRPLNQYPPTYMDVTKLVNRTLDTDWNIPLCSFVFSDVYDGTFRLLASLDVNGRHSCNRFVVLGKTGNYYHVYNDWKVVGADNVADMLSDVDNDHSPEIIMTQAWSKTEGGHCTATWRKIYKWSRGHFSDASASFPNFYKKRLKELQNDIATENDPTCHQMEMDKIATLLGSSKAEIAQAKIWMKSPDASLRRKAAALFADLDDDSAKKNLALLTKDADPLTAESAQLYLESPRSNKE